MRLLAALIAMLVAFTPAVLAVPTYHAFLTDIRGGPNEEWTENTENNLQVALRARNTATDATVNISGVYEFDAGVPWAIDISINSDVAGFIPVEFAPAFASFATLDFTGIRNLTSEPLRYLLSVDNHPGPETSFVNYDPLSFTGNYLGDNNTGNGEGIVSTDYDSYNILQTSIPQGSAVPGLYDVVLSVIDAEDTVLNSVSFQAHVSPVPDTGSTLFLLSASFGSLGLGGFIRNQRKYANSPP
jgi:hypothetical protein